MQRIWRKSLRIDMTRPQAAIPDNQARTGLSANAEGTSLVYDYDTRAERSGVARLIADLAAEGLAIRDLSTSQSSLEEVFLTLVKEDAA
jgi:ABC-2 type transport system ATP-binding protein